MNIKRGVCVKFRHCCLKAIFNVDPDKREIEEIFKDVFKEYPDYSIFKEKIISTIDYFGLPKR
jgi:hypothetical protein